MNKIVYRHLKPNGEVFYIGIGDVIRAYRKVGRNKHWKNIVNKYGYEVQILKEDLSWEDACELECILIDYYGRRDLGLGPLVNMTDGGEGTLNYTHSEETRVKLSEANTGKFMSEETKLKISEALTGKKVSDEAKAKISEANRGKPSPRKGKTLSDETRAKISEAQIGKTLSEETKLKISKANKGFKHSEETRQKLRDANLGKTLSEETKDKISKASKGKERTEEHRKNLSKANRGKTHSEETRRKLSEANKGGRSYRAKKVINTETGEIFDSIRASSIDAKMNEETLRQKLIGKRKNNTNYKLYE